MSKLPLTTFAKENNVSYHQALNRINNAQHRVWRAVNQGDIEISDLHKNYLDLNLKTLGTDRIREAWLAAVGAYLKAEKGDNNINTQKEPDSLKTIFIFPANGFRSEWEIVKTLPYPLYPIGLISGIAKDPETQYKISGIDTDLKEMVIRVYLQE